MNPITTGRISTAITKLTKADALAPIVALEGTVVAGRTYQAYKRGKWDEARERFIEETVGSIVWLCGVKYLNIIGDKLVSKILKTNVTNFDVGTDKVLRTPFDNFMKKIAPKGFSPKQVALIKAAKVLTSVIAANLIIGFLVPPLNQKLTEKLRHDRKMQNKNSKTDDINIKKPSEITFKGGAFNVINKFTNCIENTNTGQLLSSDAGIAGGRMYNARRKEERREVAIRDLGSIYFYMWAQGHVRNLLNLVESGKSTRLNPATAQMLHEHLIQFIQGKEMRVEDFKKAVLGSNVNLPQNLQDKFKSSELSFWEKITKQKPLEVIELSELEKVLTDSETINLAREMSKLQPKRLGVSVLTKQQVLDSINKAEINNPIFLNKIFDEFTGGEHKNEYKFISNKSLYKLKSEMEDYVNTICKASKNGKVDKSLIEKTLNKNITYNGINFMVGFGVAAAFLSTIIPKIQYYVTRKTTGIDAFPGVYDFEHHHEVDA